MKINDKIKLTLMNQSGRRLEAVSTIIEFRDGNPYVRVESDQFIAPLKIDLISEDIDLVGDYYQHRGELQGAILIPDFQWLE
jgi:hypothetical protein